MIPPRRRRNMASMLVLKPSTWRAGREAGRGVIIDRKEICSRAGELGIRRSKGGRWVR